LTPLYDAYRREAEQCQRLAFEAPTAELRMSFMLQASDWLSMIPPEFQVAGAAKSEGRDRPEPTPSADRATDSAVALLTRTPR
jgi:hypothetical protein